MKNYTLDIRKKYTPKKLGLEPSTLTSKILSFQLHLQLASAEISTWKITITVSFSTTPQFTTGSVELPIALHEKRY